LHVACTGRVAYSPTHPFPLSTDDARPMSALSPGASFPLPLTSCRAMRRVKACGRHSQPPSCRYGRRQGPGYRAIRGLRLSGHGFHGRPYMEWVQDEGLRDGAECLRCARRSSTTWCCTGSIRRMALRGSTRSDRARPRSGGLRWACVTRLILDRCYPQGQGYGRR
jgi:hypothetical protein